MVEYLIRLHYVVHTLPEYFITQAGGRPVFPKEFNEHGLDVIAVRRANCLALVVAWRAVAEGP